MVSHQKKQEGAGQKVRLIADCRALNKFLSPGHFKLDHWSDIFPFLRQGIWGAKVDLKHAYFHLHNSEALRPYMRINVGSDIYQFNAAVFGLSTLPQIFMSVMKVLQKVWRQKGLLVFVYLNDILILGTTKLLAQKCLDSVLETLRDSGFCVNEKKSLLTPTQELQHLGFHISLQNGVLSVPADKLKMIRRELGKLVTHFHLTTRKMAAILGTGRSFLTAMPFLRAFTNQMMSFVQLSKTSGWDSQLPVPPTLKEEVLKINDLMHSWAGRKFQGKCPVRELHSDSSNHAWAGVDLRTGGAVQEFWRSAQGLHINVKELSAAVQTVKSLTKPKERVLLGVDNSVAFSYSKKGGGRKTHLNLLMQDLWEWCME